MKPSRIDFYDPLYEFVTFEEAARRRGRGFLDPGFARKEVTSHGESLSPLRETKVIIPFLSSIEFTRQTFLRQSNLAFLVYPSATHTRFAHAIGACYLGFVASQRIAVGEMFGPNDLSHPEYLSNFLEKTGLREEFYLALLLHDVGHFPFSHALENNRDFWDEFGKEIHHEEAACQLIQGEGPIYEASKRRSADLSRVRKKEHPHLANLFQAFRDIDKDAICYLISGDHRKYLAGKSDRKCAQLRVVHELVSGLLDLDRVDHYRRDNYFTGLRTGTSLNFPSLLGGLTLYYDPRNWRIDPELRLSTSAIGQAISLLQNKERLGEDCFEHPDNIAYEAMLHHSFNLHIYGEGFYKPSGPLTLDDEVTREVYDMLVTTDETFLFQMAQRGSKVISDIVFRIMNRAPYHPVAKLKFPPEHRLSLSEIRLRLASAAEVSPDEIIVRVLKSFGSTKLGVRTSEWLDLERLKRADGTRLVDGKYKRQIEHFQQPQDRAHDPLWLFSPNKQSAQKLGAVLNGICKKLRCSQEEL
jgi:HD superfamily phosphohydrolase